MTTDTHDWFGFRVMPWNQPLRRPGVYLLTNMTNGKTYVGVGGVGAKSSVYDRLYAHTLGGSPVKLKNAILKHGRSHFIIQPIYYSTNHTSRELLEIETKLIKEYNSIRHGYNVIETSYGGGSYGPLFNETVRAALTNPVAKAKSSAKVKAARSRNDVKQKYITYWSNESNIATHSARMVSVQLNPEVKARHRAAIHRINETPGFLTSRGRAISQAIASPLMQQKWRAAQNLPGVKERQSEDAKNRIWITNGIDTKRIRKELSIPDGWRLGRVFRRTLRND